jgi:hypothetical protein
VQRFSEFLYALFKPLTTSWNRLIRYGPRRRMMLIATIEISAARRAYSIMSWPASRCTHKSRGSTSFAVRRAPEVDVGRCRIGIVCVLYGPAGQPDSARVPCLTGDLMLCTAMKYHIQPDAS